MKVALTGATGFRGIADASTGPSVVEAAHRTSPARRGRHARSRDRLERRLRGRGGDIPGLLLASPRDPAGNLIMIGSRRQHWPSVHVEDLADSFRRVLEDDSARGYYVIGNGVYSAVAELTEAAAASVGAPGAVPGSDTEARGRLGDDFAEVLLLDQGTTAAKARSDLGWTPSRPTLVDEFLQGSYRR